MNCLKEVVLLEPDKTDEGKSLRQLRADIAEGKRRYSLPAMQLRRELQEQGGYRRYRSADSYEGDDPPPRIPFPENRGRFAPFFGV